MTRYLPLLLILWAGAANAHAILVGGTPAAGGSLQAGPQDITLRFNARIDRARSRLTLIAPDKTAAVLAVPDAGPPDVMSAHATLVPGPYTVRWQVLAVDGHITRGAVPFQVTAP